MISSTARSVNLGLLGKYDFRGIKKYGAKGLILAIESSSVGGVLLKWGFKGVLTAVLEALANWLANKGLIILNVGAISVSGEWDQKAFDASIEEALSKIQSLDGKLTPEQIKAIDDEVIRTARKFLSIR